MSDLAINGGNPVRETLFPEYRTIASEEKQAVERVLDGGKLSQFIGAWHPHFGGGEEVKALEREWAEYFGVKHAISVNSNTSGLYCAMGAVGLEPGDEVIVTPYSMSVSACAPLLYGGIPVFADIDPDYFCLDPQSIAEKITPRTRAIIVVDLFGGLHDVDAISALAEKYNLKVIEDAAQAPGATWQDKYAGCCADIGVFSLNYHKHIHSGEGGIVVTDDDNLAERVRLIRNHAESVVEGMGHANLSNMVGFNFRMTELEAAIARCQLQKLDGLLATRIANTDRLATALAEISGITPAQLRPGTKHAYYILPCRFDEKVAGVSRDQYISAVKAELAETKGREGEGVLIGQGYVKPLYLQPLYQQRIAFGSGGYPFTLAEDSVTYEKGLCPVVEQMHYSELFTCDLSHSFMSTQDIDDVIEAFHKVWQHRSELS